MNKRLESWRVLAAYFILFTCASAACARSGTGDSFSGAEAFAYLRRVVAFGPRPPGSAALAACRRWVVHELQLDGCKVELDPFVASTPDGEIRMVNIIAKIPGSSPSVIMLAGHYDTKLEKHFRFVGANDGGSSTAFLLEMARVLGKQKQRDTIWLVFFDGEEAIRSWSATDGTYGSRQLAAKLTSSGELSRIRAMILVDMIAGKHLEIHPDAASTQWLTKLVFRTARRLGYEKYFANNQPTALGDDHTAFVNDGVSAVDILGPVGPVELGDFFGIDWHTAEDTLEHCSPHSLEIVGRVVTAVLDEIEHSSGSH